MSLSRPPRVASHGRRDPLEVRMKRPIFIVFGLLLAIAGVVWTLQGLNLLGQTGGMNGQMIWAIIGPITALVGLALAAIGVRTRPSGRS